MIPSNLARIGGTQLDLPAGMPLNVPVSAVATEQKQEGAPAPSKKQDGAASEAPTAMIFSKPQTPFPTIIANLKFEQLSQYLNSFELGLYRYVVRIWNLMRKRDSHLLSVSSKRFKRVSKFDWEIVPNDSTPDAIAQAEFLSDFYSDITVYAEGNRREKFGLKKAIRHLMTATANQYAACEIEWLPGTGEDGTIRVALDTVRADYFDQSGGTMKVYADAYSGDGLEIPDDKFIIHRADEALMIAGSILFVMKQISLGQWNQFADRFGMPGLIGTAPESASQASRDVLQKVVENWVATMAAVLPPGYDVKTVQAAVSGSLLPAALLVDWCDSAQSVLWAGGNLTTKSESGSGTLAGGAQRDQELEVAEDDADSLAETLDMQLSAPAVKFQFGQPLLCSFKFKVAKAIDLAAAIQVDAALIKGLGVKYALADLRAKYGVRAPEDDEEIVTPPAAPAQGDSSLPTVPSLRSEISGTDGTALKASGRLPVASGQLDVGAEAQAIAGAHGEAGRAALQTMLDKLHGIVGHAATAPELEAQLKTLQGSLPTEQFQRVVQELLGTALKAGDKSVRTAIQTTENGGAA